MKPSTRKGVKDLASDEDDEEDRQLAATMYGGLISHSESSEEETKDPACHLPAAGDKGEQGFEEEPDFMVVSDTELLADEFQSEKKQ